MDKLDAAAIDLPGVDVRVVERCISTNTSIFEKPIQGPILLAAEEQTAGRGRRGRSWESPPGRNLTVSVALRPRLAAGAAWQLAVEPELLIADEAVSALDVSVQAQVLALLEEIRGRLDLAMLFITHDLRVAAQVCDHVAVMRQGRVVEYGPAEEVFLRPRHEYTQALFAAAPGRDFAFAA